jgi:osmotically-inducible protein OsmY
MRKRWRSHEETGMRPPASISSPPADIAQARSFARAYDIRELRLTRSGGVAVLEGFVPCYRMKKRAGDALALMPGVLQVINRLRVVPQEHRGDEELRGMVRAALRRQPSLAGADIDVSTLDGVVTLRGSVASLAARSAAEEVVWSVGGVSDLHNQLSAGQLPAA